LPLFLKSIELFGFKSFADRTRLEFSEGTTSLLGPNGCGKSNIVDAIKWVLGEQSTKTLRASKMEDVIFNGTESRKPLNVAEVTLCINNEEGLLPTEHTEVEIRRRIYRTGDSEYFINRNPVRLKDIRELFFDTGIGKSAYSILEQGKIDQILSTRPEDRRYIFEEAAGITRYKSKSIEAQKKLERTEENLMQVESVLSEVKRQYDSRKAQAAKALRYKELERELLELEIDVQLTAVKNLTLLRSSKEAQLKSTQARYQDVNELVKTVTESLEEKQALLRRTVEQKIAIQTRLQRLEEQRIGKKEQLQLLQQRYRDFLKTKEDSLERSRRIQEKIDRDLCESEDQKDRLANASKKISILLQQKELSEKELEQTKQLMTVHEHEIEEKEEQIAGYDSLMRDRGVELQALTDSIVAQIDAKLVASAYSSQTRKDAEKAFTEQMKHVRDHVSQTAQYVGSLDIMQKQRSGRDVGRHWEHIFDEVEQGLRRLADLFETYRNTIPSFIDDFIAPEGIITKKRQIDESLTETRKNIESDRNRITELREANRTLAAMMEQIRERIVQIDSACNEQRSKETTAKALLENYERSLTEQQYTKQDAESDAETAESRAFETTNSMNLVTEEQKRISEEIQSLNDELERISLEIDAFNEQLAEERQQMNTRYEQLHGLRSEIDKYGFHIENLNQQIQQIFTNFYDSYGKSLKEYEDRLENDIEDAAILRERVSEIKKQIQQMGYINHMAEEEFSEIKERFDFLNRQTADLAKAKQDLFRVIDEITKRSEQLFMESYQKIRVGFQEMFHRMFGGGRAELKLLDPEHVLESGIDILAQPPGKRLDRLAPLSGGEKSLTAVALLFATYQVKPSPFCILDEIDAALDDRNIGNFLSVLEDFSRESQFIIITHNKRTVLGAKTLLGVTMQEHGISKAIAWKLGWDSDKETIFSEQVDIRSDNTV